MLSTRTHLILALGILAIAAQAVGQPDPRGGYGWNGTGPALDYGAAGYGRDPREGKVSAAAYVTNGPNAAGLGHGTITVTSGPGTMTAGLESAVYEAAVVDQLIKAGYQNANGAKGQLAELVVSHDVIRPEEPPHSPVSGEVAAEFGNHGHAMGMAVNVDLTKPAKALTATRLDARIRDSSTQELLWEGHAEIVTREGDKRWTGPQIAERLAAALFKDFPRTR